MKTETYTPGALRAAYEAISDAGIAVASGNPSLLVHKHIDAAKEAIKQAAEERRGLLEALKELLDAVSRERVHPWDRSRDRVTAALIGATEAIAQAQEGK